MKKLSLIEAEKIMEENGGNLDLSDTEITELPNRLSVSGSLDLSGTKITKLPEELTVGGCLYLSDTLITELPKGLTVGGGLYLRNTPIKRLPKGLIGGSLDLSGTKITKLSDELTVVGSLDLRNTLVTKLPDKLTVGGELYFDGNIKLNNSLKIGGLVFDSSLKLLTIDPKNKLKEGEYKKGKYIFADGIFTLVTGEKKVKGYTYYKGLFKDNVVYDGKNYAHCKTFKQGVRDLQYKAAKNRGAEQYNNLTLDDVVSTSDLITMYRVVTGACLQGTEIFVESLGNKLKNEYTIKEAIELTNGQYGSNDFKNFFKK